MERPDWEHYFMQIAKDVSTRATCSRASVGAVIVKDNRIISTGYNGAPSGESHCIEAGCLIESNHCQRAIHAEVNAVCQAAKFGISVHGADVYIYGLERPEACHNCLQVMKTAGIKRIIENIDGMLVNTVL